MFDQLEDLVLHYQEIMRELSEPDVSNNKSHFQSLMKEQGDLAPIVKAYEEYKTCEETINDFYPIKRQGDFLSSTKIREIIRKNELTSLKELIPIDSYNTISQKSNENKLLSIEDFSLPLHYALLNSKELNIYLDGNEDLANRTGKLLGEYIDIYDFAKNKLKSKNYTLTHIMRYLLHILLNITKTDLDLLKKNYAPYAHILGVRKNRKDLLSKIQENTSIPIFASYKEAVNSLNGEKLKLYERDLFADTVYNAVLTNKSKTRIKDERSRKLLVI